MRGVLSHSRVMQWVFWSNNIMAPNIASLAGLADALLARQPILGRKDCVPSYTKQRTGMVHSQKMHHADKLSHFCCITLYKSFYNLHYCTTRIHSRKEAGSGNPYLLKTSSNLFCLFLLFVVFLQFNCHIKMRWITGGKSWKDERSNVPVHCFCKFFE